jgi:hypothetical protein
MITQDEFRNFENLRKSGVTNMYAVETVSLLSGLTKKQIIEIIETYDDLVKKYGK